MTASPVNIERLAIIGVGLIGGSLARALRGAGAVGSVVGIGRSRANLEDALALGICDEITQDALKGVEGADMVFISVPVCSIPSVVAEIAPALAPGCIVTDGGSVKSAIVRECEAHMPPGCHFGGRRAADRKREVGGRRGNPFESIPNPQSRGTLNVSQVHPQAHRR